MTAVQIRAAGTASSSQGEARRGRPATTSVRPFWPPRLSSAGQSASSSSASGISTRRVHVVRQPGQVGDPLAHLQAVVAQHVPQRRPARRRIVPVLPLQADSPAPAPSSPSSTSSDGHPLGHQAQHPVVHPAEPASPGGSPPNSTRSTSDTTCPPGAAAPAAAGPDRAGNRRWSGAARPGSDPCPPACAAAPRTPPRPPAGSRPRRPPPGPAPAGASRRSPPRPPARHHGRRPHPAWASAAPARPAVDGVQRSVCHQQRQQHHHHRRQQDPDQDAQASPGNSGSFEVQRLPPALVLGPGAAPHRPGASAGQLRLTTASSLAREHQSSSSWVSG